MSLLATDRAIRLRRLKLENVRCFQHIDLDFAEEASGEPVAWTVILGDNGSGKSTLLKVLGLALASPKEAIGLFESDTKSEWLRHGASEGGITVEVDVDGEARTSHLRIVQERYGERLEIESYEAFPAEALFLCGYGANRRSFGADSHRSYSGRGALATLFDAEAPLQNPELSLRRVSSESPGREMELLHRIDRVLTLPEGSVRLGREGLEVSGAWGTFLPVGALSEGYKATLGWVMDMIGWVLLRDPSMLDRPLEGIVLVDEIEQHLHPSWQRRIIGRLREQFPGLQFVVTTHAPLCVTGTTDLQDSEVNLVHLRWEENFVETTGGMKPPRGQRADQVLTSYLFGLETTSDDATKREIAQLSQLLSKGEDQLSVTDREEILELRARLDEKLGSAETPLEREVAEHVGHALDAAVIKRVEHLKRTEGDADSASVMHDLEVRRQLKQMLG